MQPSLLRSIVKSRIASNTFYLMLLQVLNNILPLLTIPYLARVLGAEYFGVISLAQVIAVYCNVIADYGFNLSATRVISMHKEDAAICEQTFNAVITLKIAILLLCFIIITPFILFTDQFYAYKEVYFISYSLAIGQTLFPVWYFQGIQNMRFITVINGVSKLLFTIPIFFLVKGVEDLLLVPILNGAGAIIAGAAGVYFAVKNGQIKYHMPHIKELKQQLKDGFDVFIPTFFSGVINNGGAFVLGVFHGEVLVGYYMAIDKLVRAGLNLFYPLSQALFPSMAEALRFDKKSALKKLAKVGGVVSGIVALGGIISYLTSDFWVSLIYGPDYTQYAYVLDVLMVWFFFGVVNNFIGVQFLVAGGLSVLYRKSFMIAGVFTFGMFYFIRYLAIDGVILAMLSGEVVLSMLLFFTIYKKRLIHS